MRSRRSIRSHPSAIYVMPVARSSHFRTEVAAENSRNRDHGETQFADGDRLRMIGQVLGLSKG